MGQIELLATLSETHRKHADPASPGPLRMMAARGMAPLPPREMVIVLATLSLDEDQKLTAAARDSIAKLPSELMVAALDSTLPPDVLQVVGPLLLNRADLLERIVLNRATSDVTISLLAPLVPAEVAEIIASNQERCLRSEAIVRALVKNTNILRSSLDRLFDFLVRSGILLDGMREFSDAMERLSPTEVEEVAGKIELPPEVAAHLEEGAKVTLSSTAPVSAVSDADQQPAEESSAEETKEGEAVEEETKQIPITQMIANMTTAQKMIFAMKGNKEARSILVRDSNRVVSTGAIRNPRITEQEVAAAANSRSVNEDVIRIIAASKEMTRTYSVKVALVNNPKTPFKTASRFLTLLRQSELRAVAKSKNVSGPVSKMAKQMLQAKLKGGR